jgi:hypothetical protein
MMPACRDDDELSTRAADTASGKGIDPREKVGHILVEAGTNSV